MKTIQSVNLWVDGQQVPADKLVAIISFDDLETTATFTWMVGIDTGNPIVQFQSLSTGQVVISGQQYIDWDNSNEQAYQIVADSLNLVIIP
jgi:hypothetical protein